MALSESLVLDIDAAMSGIDKIEAALTDAATSFKVGLIDALSLLSEVKVEDVDASSITAGIDAAIGAADLTTTVEGDASAVTTEIDSAVAAADTAVTIEAVTDAIAGEITAAVGAADTTIVPEVDVGPATEQLTELAAAASDAGGGSDSLARGLEGVSGAAELAGGNVSGIAASLGSFSETGAAITGSLLGIGAALGESVKLALQAEQANARFDRSLGEVGATIEAINIPGFAADFEELATATGSSVAGLKNSVSGIADLGRSAGASGPQVADAAENITLLAARASVLRPELGDAGEAAQTLFRALITGRASALAPFGIALSDAAIAAAQTRLGIQGNIADLDPFTRALIRADAAAAGFGTRLKTDIVEGAQSPAVQLRVLRAEFEEALVSFGKPLLGPLVEAAREGQPILVDIARTFGQLGGEALPLLIEGLRATQPLVASTADVVGVLGQVLGPVADIIQALPGPVVTLAEALLLLRVSGVSDLAISLAGSLSPALTASVGQLGVWGGALTIAGAGLLLLHQRSEQATRDIGDITIALRTGGDAVDAFDKQVRAASGGANAIGPFDDAFRKFEQTLDVVNTKGEATEKIFRALAASDPTAAGQLLTSLEAAGRDTGNLREILNSVPAAASAAAGGTDVFAEALGHLSGNAAAADAALGELFGRAVEQVDAQRGLADAQRSVRDAQERVNEAVSTGGGVTKSATERSLELRAAQLGVSQANASLTDSSTKLTEAQQNLADIYVVTEEETHRITEAQRSLEDAQDSYRAATDRVAEAQQHLADVVRAATRAEADKARRDVRSAQLSEADLRDQLEDANKQVDLATRSVQRAQGSSTTRRAAAAEALDDALRKQEESEIAVANAADRTKDVQADAADKLDGTIGTVKDATEAQAALDDAQRAQADAADQVTKAQKDLADAQDATQVSAKELADATRAVEQAQLAHEQAALAADQAEFRLQQTQDGTTASSGRATSSVHALRDAQEALAGVYETTLIPAIGRNKDALDSADGTAVTAEEHARNLIAAYRETANTVGNDSPLGRHLNETADVLQRSFDRDYNVTLDADTGPARQSINDLLRDLRNIPGLGAIIPVGGAFADIPGAMAGMTNFEGGIIRVGERGPETVVLPPGSDVVRNNQSATSGGVTVGELHVHEVTPDPRTTTFKIGALLGELSQR